MMILIIGFKFSVSVLQEDPTCVCAHARASMYEEGDRATYILANKISILVCLVFVVLTKLT